jgi:ribosomal peptide maturation radical SAM protein 1
MPFGYLRLPSIALTQLKAAVQACHGDLVALDLLYLNFDFADFLSPALYDFISESPAAMHCNLGEWFFRQVAFPDAANNSIEYLDHFGLRSLDFSNGDAEKNLLRFYAQVLRSKRELLEDFMDQLIRQYHLTEYDVIGFTSMFSQNLPVFAMARRLKLKKTGIVLVMGGANCESPMGQAIVNNIPDIDFVFSGPALISFPVFLGQLLTGDKKSCHRLDGVFSRENVSGDVSHGLLPKGKEMPINQSPALDYDDFIFLITTRWKALDVTPVLLFETSRGCWWGAMSHCTFCGLNSTSMQYRTLDASVALHMLHDLFDRYGSTVKHFSSVDNIMPKEYLSTVFPYLRVPADLSMFYEVKADLSREQLEVMARSRILTLQPGIESLSTLSLKRMKKGETAVQNISFLKNAAILNMDIAWNLLIGFPGEDPSAYEMYDQDFSNWYHLQPPKSIYSVRFDRYSPYHSSHDVFGLHLIPADFYYFLYPESMHKDLGQIAYYFEDAHQDAPYKRNAAQWMPVLKEKVAAWKERFKMEDGYLKPMLYLKYDTNQIVDTRSGKMKRKTIDFIEIKILELADQPIHLNALIRALPDHPGELLRIKLEELIVQGYIFHEHHKKYLSLVNTRTPAANEKQYDALGMMFTE